jgi:hypothetical protein
VSLSVIIMGRLQQRCSNFLMLIIKITRVSMGQEIGLGATLVSGCEFLSEAEAIYKKSRARNDEPLRYYIHGGIFEHVFISLWHPMLCARRTTGP